jgi:hypothetical protein
MKILNLLLALLFISDAYSEGIGNITALEYDSKKGHGEFIVSSHSCDYILEEDIYKSKATVHCQSNKTPLVSFHSSSFRNDGCEISYTFQCETQEYKKERQEVEQKAKKAEQMAKEVELARLNAQKAQLAEEARQKALWDKELRQIEIEVKKAQERIKQERSQEEIGSPSPIIRAKQKCKEIGFKTGTEKFGNCVLELTK